MRQSDHTVKNFKREIIINGTPVQFEFVTMNRVHKQLFQVHVEYEAKKHRFHMQGSETTGFHITLRDVCPEPLWAYEKTLADAIIAS